MVKASDYTRVATDEDADSEEFQTAVTVSLAGYKDERASLSDESIATVPAHDTKKECTRVRTPSRVHHLAVGVVLLVSLTNLFLLLSNFHATWALYRSGMFSTLGSPISPLTHENGLLKRPDAYIGLDRLPSDVAHAALPDSLVVFPPLFHPIDYLHPDRVFPDDQLARFTFNGRISPTDRHVILTQEISMIAQFRVQDYGMERCRIVANIPSPTISDQNGTAPFVIQGNTSSLQVWNLTTPAPPNSELDVHTLSRSTRPPRGLLLTHFDVEEGASHSSGDFWCGPSGSLQTLEIHCHDEGCRIDFFQSFYSKTRFGIYVSQGPSI